MKRSSKKKELQFILLEKEELMSPLIISQLPKSWHESEKQTKVEEQKTALCEELDAIKNKWIDSLNIAVLQTDLQTKRLHELTKLKKKLKDETNALYSQIDNVIKKQFQILVKIKKYRHKELLVLEKINNDLKSENAELINKSKILKSKSCILQLKLKLREMRWKLAGSVTRRNIILEESFVILSEFETVTTQLKDFELSANQVSESTEHLKTQQPEIQEQQKLELMSQFQFLDSEIDRMQEELDKEELVECSLGEEINQLTAQIQEEKRIKNEEFVKQQENDVSEAVHRQREENEAEYHKIVKIIRNLQYKEGKFNIKIKIKREKISKLKKKQKKLNRMIVEKKSVCQRMALEKENTKREVWKKETRILSLLRELEENGGAETNSQV